MNATSATGATASATRFAPASGPLRGSLTPPADKSISHRAALLAAIGEGETQIERYLHAADTNSTLDAVRALGARVTRDDAGTLRITGVGLRGAAGAGARESLAIDVGNAGTLMRLLAGWLAGQQGRRFTLDGDASIRRRPLARVIEPLREMGARMSARDGGLAPLEIEGAPLHGIDHAPAVASAQVKSAILLAALLAEGETRVRERQPTRDHTERMLLAGGVALRREHGAVTLTPGAAPALGRVRVPGDPSSAAFWIAAALIVPGSQLLLEGVSLNWTRCGFIEIARRMGARIEGELEQPNAPLGERDPTGTLEVSHGPLAAGTVEPGEVALAIDELPLVALLGCFAEGETVVRGAAELRVKESDRIATVSAGLRALGGEIEGTDDGFRVRGTGGLRGGTLDAHGDHRLAMLGAIAGLGSREGVAVAGMEAAAVSYPGFAEDLRRLA